MAKYLFFSGVKWSMVKSKDRIHRLDVIKNNATILMAISIILKIPRGVQKGWDKGRGAAVQIGENCNLHQLRREQR